MLWKVTLRVVRHHVGARSAGVAVASGYRAVGRSQNITALAYFGRRRSEDPQWRLVPERAIKSSPNARADTYRGDGDWICLDILKTEDEMKWYRTPDYTVRYVVLLDYYFHSNQLPRADLHLVILYLESSSRSLPSLVQTSTS